MEVDSGGAAQSRKRTRRPRNKIEKTDDLTTRECSAMKEQKSIDQEDIETDDSISLLISRGGSRSSSLSCARCRVFNWVECRYAKQSKSVNRALGSPVQRQSKSVAHVSASESFIWNLSLAERSKRDSRSSLPTSKTKPQAVNRRFARNDLFLDEDSDGRCSAYNSAVFIGPSTSGCYPETPVCSRRKQLLVPEEERTNGRPVRRRRKSGAYQMADSLEGSSVSRHSSPEERPVESRGPAKKRAMGQAAPMRSTDSSNCARACPMLLRRSGKTARSLKCSSDEFGKSIVADGPPLYDPVMARNGDTTDDGECNKTSKGLQFMDDEMQERTEKTELAKRAMEELMKRENLAPVEMIVADAIRKDPIGFVHSLRDAKLLKSLEKLAQHRKLSVSSDESRTLRKQRKKEKKREKKREEETEKVAKNCCKLWCFD